MDVHLAHVDQTLDQPAQPEFLHVDSGFTAGRRGLRVHRAASGELVAQFLSESLYDSSTGKQRLRARAGVVLRRYGDFAAGGARHAGAITEVRPDRILAEALNELGAVGRSAYRRPW